VKTPLVLLLGLSGCASSVAAWDPQHPTPQGPPPPALRSPAALERVTTARPRFTWRLPPGESSVIVEVCRDRGCKRVVVRHEIHGRESWTPDGDLPSGPAYWRAFGKSGELVGEQPSEARALAIDTNVSWSGAHVEVIVPASNSDYGKRLVPKLDAAAELYAKILNIRLPPGTVPLLFYGSDEAYLLSHGRSAPIAHEAGFASEQARDSQGQYIVSARSSAVHVKFGVQDGIDDDPDASGLLEEVALHELAHAVQFTGVFHYHDLPAWWVEGLSELLASRAKRDIFGVPFERQFSLARRARLVERLHATHKMVPLTDLLTFESTRPHSSDPETVAALYGESFCLLHFLDVEQPEAFGRLMQSVANMSSLHGSTTQLRQLTGDLSAFESRWLTALAKEPLAQWNSGSDRVELRTTADELVLAAPAGEIGPAVYVGPTVGAAPAPTSGERVEATVDVHAGDALSACLWLRGGGGNYAACIYAKGSARLIHLEKKSQILAQAKFLPLQLGPGTPHRLSLELGHERWTLRLDDVEVLSAAAPAASVSAWGVAADNGRSHYRDVHLAKSTP
jgi:hypothetical protein